MSSATETKQSTDPSSVLDLLARTLKECDAVIIGAGAGLSASAGHLYSGERFKEYFADFEEKYGFHDMYSGGFYPYGTPEEKWGYWCRHVYANRYTDPEKPVYSELLRLVKDKDYFVLTTNVDHCFQKAGFDKERLFYTQGDYGLFQCSKPCCRKTWDNETQIKKMYEFRRSMRVPPELIPRCPRCGREATMNLRCDDTFVQDIGWERASDRYEDFLFRHRRDRILYLEIGVGFNTPAIIKYNFWQRVYSNKNSTYACINKGETVIPDDIADRSFGIDGDCGEIITALLSRM